MNTLNLLRELADLGVELWLENGALRYRAPSGIMNNDRLALLRQHKGELIAALEQENLGVMNDKPNRFEPYPLTGLQSAYLLGRSEVFTLGGVDCHGYLEFRFDTLDLPRLQQAWQQLVNRHDMLRTVVHNNGNQQTLETLPDLTLPFTDARGHSEEHQQQTLAQQRERLSHYRGEPENGPLVRVEITQMANCAVLHVSVNLLICDFQSARQLLAELNSLYSGETLSPPPTITFRDYVLAMLRERERPAYQRARDYWLGRIESLPAAPLLPASKAAPTSNFYRHGFTLAPAPFKRLSGFAAEHNLGVSTVFLTLYAETLRRWGAQPHFAIAMTMMQREPLHADVDKLIGDFSAVELLEVNLASSGSVITQAQALQQQLWQDLDYAKFTGVEVMRELSRQRGREAAHYPVAFTSAIASGMDCQTRLLPGATQTYAITQTPQVALDCQIGPGEEGLAINWDIREGTLDTATSAAMFSAFQQAILALSHDESAWHRPLSLPLPAEQQQRRRQVNDTQAALPDALIHAGIWQQAKRTPDAVAVIDPHRSLSYRTLISRADALASRLLHRGIKPGQLVAVALEKGVSQIVAVLACLRAGAAYLPLDLTLPVKRQAWLVELAQPAIVLTQRTWPVLTDNDGALPYTMLVDELNDEHLPAVWPSVTTDSLAYVIFTSGSTGEPKGVMVSHAAATNTLEEINRRLRPVAGDRLLGLANLSFDLSVYDIFGTLGCGATLVLPDSRHRSDPAQLAVTIEQQGITLWNSVPAQLAMLADYLHSGSASDCTTLRAALLSGDWIPVDLPNRIRQKIPNNGLYGLGGATEVAIWSVIYPIGQVEPGWQSIPYGTPLANQQLYVLDSEMRDCPENVAGELYIGGKGLAIGYLGDKQKTAQRFITHPLTAQRLYRTGDLACHLPDGNLQFLGREDNQLKIRGHRIELAEIESTLTRHPNIASAAALVIDRATPAQRLVAFATPGKKGSTSSRSTLPSALSTLARRLAEEMDRPQVLEVAQGIERVSLKAMAHSLLSLAAFKKPQHGISLVQLINVGDVAPRHERLIARWLTTLTREGYLCESGNGSYLPVRTMSADEVEQEWDSLQQLDAKVNWGGEILRYMRDSHRHLIELMRNEADPLDLLFPEGQTHVAEAAYRDNLVSRTMNALVCGVVGHIAAEKNGGTLRLLEVGAGVGGTSLDLIPSLENYRVDYLFSDVSNYFLNEAEKRFSAWPWVHYGLYDINQPPLKQGIETSSRDVVLCCNVLHNARHAGDVIGKLREVLAPGGWLVFIEATSNSYQIMSSMEFKEGLFGFEDCRGEESTTFLTVEQWRSYLQQAGADRVLIAPEFDLGLDTLGQHVFAAQFKTTQADVTPSELQSHLQQWLPTWMQPDSVHLLDALPLTENGKVDRRTLSTLTPQARHSQASRSEPPVGALEKDIAAVWQSVLKIDEIGRHDNFFTLGGDSLLVAQTVSRMRSHLPQAAGWRWDTLLRTMMNEGTVAALAGQFSSEPDSFYSLKELQAGEGEGDAATLLLVHDGSGTLSPYRDLLHRLDKNQRVLGLALNSPDAFLHHPAENGIAFLANEAVQTLRQQQQTGAPLHIVGYCLGGMLASEIAHQLAADGTEIRQLSIISSYPVPFRIEDDLLAEYIFARVMQASPRELGYPTDEQGFQTLLRAIVQETPGVIPQGSLARFTRDRQDPISQSIQKIAVRTPAERLAAIGQKMPQTSHELNSASRLAEQYRLIQHSLWAVNGHRPRQTTVPMAFLRQRGEMQVLPGMNHEMTDFWQQQSVQPLVIHDVPGDHFSCLDAEHIDDVLRALGLEQRGLPHD